jgi:hypothetical protein
MSLSRYTFFTGSLHGVYDYKKDTHLHVGLLAYSGMRYSRALPIIGFDYKISPKWMLNAVFPTNMSLAYTINDHWVLDGAIRLMLTRQRFNDHEHYKRGLVAYRNWGAEAGVNFIWNPTVRVNLHVGETFAGRMRISNRKDHHRKHLRLGAAPYVGLDATISF